MFSCDFSAVGLPDDGDYLLSIATAGGQSQVATYGLTIGTVGPVGPQGPTGETGPLGPRGVLGFYSRTTGPFTLGIEPQSHTAECQVGDVVTGGGYRLQDDQGIPPQDNPTFVFTSEPFPGDTADPAGWVVTAWAPGVLPSVSLYVAIVCADIDTSIPPIPG